MGKTERILSYLPPTFERRPGPSLLFTVVDAVGRQMAKADDLLVTVMRAHWVDFADKGGNAFRDLPKLAALFDLKPRADEDIETFRTHLKSYVRTYLEGSATPRGVLRLAASTLALTLEESLEPQADDPHYVLEVSRPGDDAAFKLFGFRAGEAHGAPAEPARIVGRRDLSGGTDVSEGSFLRFSLDGDTIVPANIAGSDPAATNLWEIVRAINAGQSRAIASHDGHAVTLTAVVPGADGEIEMDTPPGDAADAVLGLAARTYLGADARPAAVIGTVDHAPAGGIPLVDLSQVCYLRLAVDGGLPVEVDCAGGDPATTSLDEVCDKINAAIKAPVAAHDGHFLRLVSPQSSAASRLDLLPAPSADARERLLGAQARRTVRGAAPVRAALRGRADLHQGVDLSVASLLRLALDGGEAVEIDFSKSGLKDPTGVTLPDIVSLLNTVFIGTVASHDGRYLTLTSTKTGAGSQVAVLTASDPARDAADRLLGVAPRTYRGSPPGPAALTGLIALNEPLDLRHQRRLWLSLDGTPRVIDCAGPDAAHTAIQQVVDAINRAAGTTIAFQQQGCLILQSPTQGAGSALILAAPEITRRRFFYTRGRVREDAATALFGFAAGRATGVLPQPARLTGTVDLSRGADLRVAHSLRMVVDDRDPLDIRIADKGRPMVTLLLDSTNTIDKTISKPINKPINIGIVTAINEALDAPVASEREGKLELISPTEGPQGRIAFETCTASDAGGVLLGLTEGAAAQGRAAERIQFVGMGDLARGLDVRTAFRLRVGIDSRAPADIDLRAGLPPGAPPILSPGQVVAALDAALGEGYVSHDGRRIILTTKQAGSASQIRIELPASDDATPAVFGLDAPRTYTGRDATSARLAGQVDLTSGIDLRERRHLLLEVDGRLLSDIDCASGAHNAAAVTLAELITAINAIAQKALGKPVAGQSDGRLVILSPTAGAGSTVVLRASSLADARAKVLGTAPTLALGKPGQSAVLTGRAKLSRPVDLSRRNVIRLSVDGGESQDIICAGEVPAKTHADEVVSCINTVFPGLASIDKERHLTLTAARRVELLALRHLTLFEFPPSGAASDPQPVRHGTSWAFVNKSVGAEPAEWVLDSVHGVDRPMLANLDGGGWLRVDAVIPAGFTLHVRLDDEERIRAWMDAPSRATYDLTDAIEAYPNAGILRLPAGLSRWTYADGYGDRFDAAFFGPRQERGKPLAVRPAHFAGGQVCLEVGVFGLTRFQHKEKWPDYQPVYGAQGAVAAPATSHFIYREHLPGRFELELPADLPPEFGGRFNSARFTHQAKEGTGESSKKGSEEGIVFPNAIFDLPEDPQALDEQVNAQPALVKARVEILPDEGVPVYDVPFNPWRPLVGGDRTHRAAAYLYQPGVAGVVKLEAKEPGAWGNLIVVSAPLSETPGGFDVTVRYTGQDVFENARPKVQKQLALARAAGVQIQVTRK